MKAVGKNLSLLAAAIILSFLLHVIVIAGLSGINIFDFGELFSPKPFHAKIVSEPSKHRPAPPAVPDNIPEEKTPSTPVTEESKTEHASEKPPLDVSQTEKPKSEAQQTAALPVPEKPLEPEKKQEEIISILNLSKEKLHFDIYWLGVYVGKAVLEAVNDKGNVKITSQVHSSPFISTFYKVEDYAESRVTNGIPSSFKIRQREGRKRSDKETFFDAINRRVTHINHIKGTKDEHNIAASNLWDVMSGFYFLRTRNFNIGETIYINIFDSNKFYQAEVEVLRKEKIVNDEKELNTVVVKPLLKSDGLFENKGSIIIWLSDDEARTPLKIETEVPIGKVVAELKSIEIEK
ncbi:MAG: DUF3108 domain-containing protein [Nitrospirae bacterium]|nr:DUF3108 domain-containing protein [Nitrospirota bacterium]MCL5976764.1 DUF3108 domain-containing protein [Nitrospirota bacterium]